MRIWIATENGLSTVHLPVTDDDFPIAMLVYQRVDLKGFKTLNCSKLVGDQKVSPDFSRFFTDPDAPLKFRIAALWDVNSQGKSYSGWWFGKCLFPIYWE